MSTPNEPAPSKVGVLIANFGGPQNAAELEPFLSRLLADVLPGPAWFSGPAGRLIARLRAPKVRPNYEAIGWSPLVPTHDRQMDLLREHLDVPLASGMMFTPPEFDDALRSLIEQGVERFVVVPMFPHYSFATTQAAYTFVWEAAERLGVQDRSFHWVPAYPTHPDYIEALGNTIRTGIENLDGEGPVELLFTPHGLPLSFVRRGDPYPSQIQQSIDAVLAHLDWTGPWHLGWQSKVGPAKWLSPSTPDMIEQLAREGRDRLLLVPLAFVSEHIETLDEIDKEFAEVAHRAGIRHFGRAPALNEDPAFIRCLADLSRTGMGAFKNDTCVRCLEKRDREHQTRTSCPKCRFVTPAWLRQTA